MKGREWKNSPLAAFPAHFSLPPEQARSTLTNGVLIIMHYSDTIQADIGTGLWLEMST